MSFAEAINEKRSNGRSLVAFPDDYCIIDIETTGLSPKFDEIIELSAVRVRAGSVVDKFTTLIKPSEPFSDWDDDDNEYFYYVDDFITELTGITNEMLETAPLFSEVCDEFLSFVGTDIVVGHNVNFDINFIYDAVLAEKGIKFENDYCDLLRISRRLFPECHNHKLSTIAECLRVDVAGSHRGLDDCITTFGCFEKCRYYVAENNINLNMYKRNGDIDYSQIKASGEVDTSNLLYGRVCVFTGTLEKMTRLEAAQLAVDCGAVCENGVTARTNFLILGNNDYCKSIKDGKSNKQKKAEALILNGQDLQIMPEDVFYDLINVYEVEEAKNIIKCNLGIPNLALALQEKKYLYFVICEEDEVECIESDFEKYYRQGQKIICFNQITGAFGEDGA